MAVCTQALGRCIRHKHDYGAILLLDERLRAAKPQSNLSRWLRDSIQCPRTFESAHEELEEFYEARHHEAAEAEVPRTCKDSILKGMDGAAEETRVGGGCDAGAAASVSASPADAQVLLLLEVFEGLRSIMHCPCCQHCIWTGVGAGSAHEDAAAVVCSVPVLRQLFVLLQTGRITLSHSL